MLDGQGGADVFVFNFKVGLSSGSVTFAGFDPGEDGKLQENELNQQYQQFLAENGIMVPDGEGGYEFADGYSWHWNDEDDALWGSDGPMSEIITYDNGQGGKEQIRYYEGTLVREQVLSVTESEGHDTIKSLQNAGPNVDKIELNGLGDLNIDELDLLFDLELVDTNGDSIADASRLVWGDGMGSITIEGNTQWGTDVRAFFGDTDQVLLL